MSTNGFLHFENGVEQGIYTAIFAQYIIRLIEDGEQYQYLPWLHYNINAGWANRISSSGVTYKDYANPAPSISNIESYDASAIPALMQVIKPESEQQVNCRSRIFYEKNLHWDFDVWDFSENDSLPRLRLFDTTSGIKKKLAYNPVEIYSHDQKIFVKAIHPVMVEVYDTLGKIYSKNRIQNDGISLPSGLYLVKTSMDNYINCHKIINH
jgi:hypothetical protein